MGSRESLVQQHAEHIGTAQPEVGLGSLHLGGVGVQAVEQLLRYPEGEDVQALGIPRSLGSPPLFHGLCRQLLSHGLLRLPSHTALVRCPSTRRMQILLEKMV